jgi:hypothetical protein
VDNFLSFASTQEFLELIRKELHATFEMKEEDPNWIMGFQLIEDRMQETIKISHSTYIDSILRRFQLADCNAITILMEHGLHLSIDDAPSTQSKMRRCTMFHTIKSLGVLYGPVSFVTQRSPSR